MSITGCFSSSYTEARAKFRAAVREAGAAISSVHREADDGKSMVFECSVDVLRRALAGLARS